MRRRRVGVFFDYPPTPDDLRAAQRFQTQVDAALRPDNPFGTHLEAARGLVRPSEPIRSTNDHPTYDLAYVWAVAPVSVRRSGSVLGNRTSTA